MVATPHLQHKWQKGEKASHKHLCEQPHHPKAEGGRKEAAVQHGIEVVQKREVDHAKGCLVKAMGFGGRWSLNFGLKLSQGEEQLQLSLVVR
jgi:hypothetical protein